MRRRLPRPASKDLLINSYARELRREVVLPAAAAIKRTVLPNLEAVFLREDAVKREPVKRLVNKARAAGKVSDKTARKIATTATQKVAAAQVRQFSTTVAAALEIPTTAVRGVMALRTVDPLGAEPWLAEKLQQAVRANVELIKDLPEDLYDRIERDLYRWGNQGLTSAEVQAKLQSGYLSGGNSELGVVGRRAELIAEDQVGKFHASLDKIRQEDIGVEEYIYRTSEDEKVRPLCRKHANKKFRWDKPPEGGHPGEKPRCRCYAEPVFPELKR